MKGYAALLLLSLSALSWQVAVGQALPDRDRSAWIQTEHLTYTAYVRDVAPPGRRVVRLRAPIIMTFTNRTKGPIHVPRCGSLWPPVLQRKANDGTWETAFGAVMPLCLEAPAVIDSGATYTMKYNILGFLPQKGPRQTDPQFHGPIAGTYRLLWGELYDVWEPNRLYHGLGHVLPEEHKISNEFLIVEE